MSKSLTSSQIPWVGLELKADDERWQDGMSQDEIKKDSRYNPRVKIERIDDRS